MANLEAQPNWSSVRLLEAHELARGGLNGNMNEQAKALAERTEFLNQEKASKSEIVQGVFEFGTYAEFDAAKATLPLNCSVVINEVNNTGSGSWNQGSNRWNGTTLTKSEHDPVQQSKEFTLEQVAPISDQVGPLVVRNLSPESGYIWALIDANTGRSPLRLTVSGKLEVGDINLPSNVVSEDQLTPSLSALIAQTFSAESGYVWALVDPITGRSPVRCAVDGTLEIDNIKFADGSIGLAKLSSDVTGFLPQKLNPESGYVWALVDPVTGRSPVRIGVDGTFYAETIRLGKSSVSESNIDSNLSRQIIAQKEDVQQTYIDPWRATKTEIALKTQGAGYWNQLPAFKTKAIFGTNTTGTSISIRKTANLPILGKYYAGEWSASNVASLRNVGSLTGPSVSNPSGTFTAGDYYYYANGSAVESTGTHAGMNVGDLLVYNGSTWVIQKAPGTVSSRGQNGYFWKVIADCTFDGVEYKAGDFILYVTRQTGGGGWQYERWMKTNKVKGDLVYMGIVSTLPASPLNNTVYEVGTAFDSYSVGDYLMYSNDAWMHIKNAVETVIANNASFYLTCTDASEYEVRRTDKSASSVGFSASSYIQSNVAKSTDELLLISDSMFGSGGVGAAILSESGRTGTVKSFGGSQSNQVMGMLEYFISQGDEFKGQTVIAWHGQNNQPSNAVNAALIRECSLKMQQLVGAIHSRIAFLSVLGQRNLAWNSASNRYVASQHESQKAKTGHLWELQDWYNKTFPNRHISPYQILIDAADDTPDPTFPGLTEKQVAQNYGIVPYSFFGGTTGEWGDVTNLRYLGNWSSSSLPTETANQFDYYLRTGGGSASEFLLVYINGQWVQKSMDITHLSNKGATALAKGVAKFLTENKM